MRTAVFSGSFNPLHIGHVAILRALCLHPEFDRVLLIVSPQNPLKGRECLGNAPDRFKNVSEAVSRYPELSRVSVDGIEMEMTPPHYTVRTLEALRKRDPESTFTQVIGADNLACIRKWKDYGKILSEFGVLVFGRKGFDTAAIREDLLKECADYRIELADFEEVDISSTEIREAEKDGVDMTEVKA